MRSIVSRMELAQVTRASRRRTREKGKRTLRSQGSGSTPLRTEEMQELKEMFYVIDENRDGLISKEELTIFMTKLGFATSAEEISDMVTSLDTNGDGCVDFKEFTVLYSSIMTKDSAMGAGIWEITDDEDLKQAFHVFDRNDDGYITPAELQNVLLTLGMVEGRNLSDCEKMINIIDTDGNGRVDLSEFRRMMSAEFTELFDLRTSS